MLRLHDTAFGEVRELELRTPGEVSMYVCGPTVYGDPHVGHGRLTLVWDIMRRYLEWRGLRVRFVSNITDIDDKIIDRAASEGRSAEEVAHQYEAAWYSAMDALGVRRPDDDPHATAWVPQMVELIARFVADGSAYETSDGVYFSAERVPDYGLLARQSVESLRMGERVAVLDEKRSPVDFVLWKKAKPGEPTWPSPWGDGRPGWHTECVVMSLGLLGEGFDVHGGGVDLMFPHHENERAQAVAAGRPFARRWVHSGHVVAGGGGEKMSKSLGNIVSLPDLLARADPRAYRLLVLQSHYRSPMEVGPDAMARSGTTLARIDEMARKLRQADAAGGPAGAAPVPREDDLDRFRALMDDDLGTPAAMALVFDLVARANSAFDRGDAGEAASAAATALAALGAVGLEATGPGDEAPAEVVTLAAERDAARAAGDWARADQIRDQLTAAGWVVKDTPSGAQIHR